VAIGRFSSRRAPLVGVLSEVLAGATSYDRVAGYFTSSILEVAGEALDSMAADAPIRVVCNSQLDALDVMTARAAKATMFQEWCASLPSDYSPALIARLTRLYHLLAGKRLQVRVLPDSTFGLIHGKAGVITRPDGSRTTFMGSTNESKSAWRLNYELVWTDDSPEACDWVQEEFEALWSSSDAFELAEAVEMDVERLTRRQVIPSVATWKARDPDPAAPLVELPVYRRENGLWAHQKSFIKRAFEEHQRGGARFVLADQVGLGKTVQLALSAKLMALWGTKPVLVLVPKPLMEQWQDELWDLLALPSARWEGGRWIDEHENVYPDRGVDELRRCPRRVGIVSQGLIVHGGKAADFLASLDYECVILDEAHRARRKNLAPADREKKAEPNNLLRFLKRIAPRTRSLLLATATPVQLSPIEAYDLLDVLNEGHEWVLGSQFSRWRTQPWDGLELILGRKKPADDFLITWEWMRDPLPPASEDNDFAILRDRLEVDPSVTWVPSHRINDFRAPDQARLERLSESFFQEHNPYIRHIVRRTREYLEEQQDPETHEPYLQPVRVRLFGEDDEEAIPLTTYLDDAYGAAKKFCEILAKRTNMNSGFLKTILLRRVGSTIYAGQRTARKMLGGEIDTEGEEDREEDAPATKSSLYPLSEDERFELERFLQLLEPYVEEDPKRQLVERLLLEGASNTKPWRDEGCIIFSQYYDSVYWLGERLSARLPEEPIGVYAGSTRSGIFRGGTFTRLPREEIKAQVRRDELRLVMGTDAASEGLNLQRLGTLINLDLPWNPTRLEQRKGRIQRIGQVRDEVLIYNMRYRGSVEDEVHKKLASRLQSISDLFGQIPDTLEDVWVHVALRQEELARQVIDAVPQVHPFKLRNDRIERVEWETCAEVLDGMAQLELLKTGW
jgi:superfamily II DNA or RNA helicase